MKRIILCVVLGFVLMPVRAQTEYDIQLFLDNIDNERPRHEELDFYLNAGKKLSNAGRYSDANALYDFAASTGSPEGFYGKAMTEEGTPKDLHLLFARKRTKASGKLLNALSIAETDLAAAMLVHDNIQAFGLTYLKDPLLTWMPSSLKDTLFLKRNDHITYMVAALKDANGYKLDALRLYYLAAWEGNYEALLKARYLGSSPLEIILAETLINRMEKQDEYVSLHKYLAQDVMTRRDYRLIRRFLINPNEILISLALGIIEPSDEPSDTPLERMAKAYAWIIEDRHNSTEDEKNRKLVLSAVKSVDSSNAVFKLRQLQKRRREEMKNKNKILETYLEEAQNNFISQLTIPDVSTQIEELRSFCMTETNLPFSLEVIHFIEEYYTEHPTPWSEQVVAIIKRLPSSSNIKRDLYDNFYSPLYQSGLMSRLHHTRQIEPTIINVKL